MKASAFATFLLSSVSVHIHTEDLLNLRTLTWMAMAVISPVTMVSPDLAKYLSSRSDTVVQEYFCHKATMPSERKQQSRAKSHGFTVNKKLVMRHL